MASQCLALSTRGVTVPALFTKFDPQAFLENEKRQGAPAKVAKAAKPDAERIGTLATLAALAGGRPNSQNHAATTNVIGKGIPSRNPEPGVQAAKPTNPAKFVPFDPANGRADWTAEDWRARFDARAGFLEHDGGLLRVQAEVQAFESCLVEWLNRNPRSSPAGRCAWCGKPETPSAMVLPFGAGENHEWLHAGCWSAWYRRRREEAVLALRGMGISATAKQLGLPSDKPPATPR